MFLGYQNNKIVLAANTRKELENAPCICLDRIEETAEEYVLCNGTYMLKAAADAAQAAADKQVQIKELQARLDVLDLKAVRALRAIQAGTSTAADNTRLVELETQAASLRQQMKELA